MFNVAKMLNYFNETLRILTGRNESHESLVSSWPGWRKAKLYYALNLIVSAAVVSTINNVTLVHFAHKMAFKAL